MIELTRIQQLKLVSLLESLVNNVKNDMEHINEGKCNCNVCVDIHNSEQFIKDIDFGGDDFVD